MPNRADLKVTRPLAVAGSALAAVAVCVALLRYGGAIDTRSLPGLPNPGPVTLWGLPAARLGSRLLAVATVGLLLAAAVLSPREGGSLSVAAYRRLRASFWTGLGWAGCALLQAAFTLADLLGRPVHLLTGPAVVSFVSGVPLGRASLAEAALAFGAVTVARMALRPNTALVALVLSVGALIPPVFTGHAASASNHQVAVSALLLHVVAVALWAGGLLALLLAARIPVTQLAVAVRRFSALAAACLALVAVSGLISAVVRLPDIDALVISRYGQLLLLKTMLLLAVAGVGAWQRRAALPAIAVGDRSRFHLLAAAEIALFAVTIGVSVALSRTPSPAGEGEETAATALLGFPMPAAISAGRVLTGWLPDPLLFAAAGGAAAAYLVGVRRLHRDGQPWRLVRTVAFLSGCGIVIVATCSGVARYAPVLISVHLLQHLLLLMVGPLLLVVGAPGTLAMSAMRPAADPAWPGPRELVQAILRLAATVSRPNVVLVLFAGSTFALYTTGLYEVVLRSHAAHLIMVGFLVGAGCLFFQTVLGELPRAVRVGMVAAGALLYAVIGVALMQYGRVLAMDWHTALARPWGPELLADQRIAGLLVLSVGEASLMAALILLLRRHEGTPAMRPPSPAERLPADVSP